MEEKKKSYDIVHTAQDVNAHMWEYSVPYTE